MFTCLKIGLDGSYILLFVIILKKLFKLDGMLKFGRVALGARSTATTIINWGWSIAFLIERGSEHLLP